MLSTPHSQVDLLSNTPDISSVPKSHYSHGESMYIYPFVDTAFIKQSNPAVGVQEQRTDSWLSVKLERHETEITE